MLTKSKPTGLTGYRIDDKDCVMEFCHDARLRRRTQVFKNREILREYIFNRDKASGPQITIDTAIPGPDSDHHTFLDIDVLQGLLT